MNLESVEDTLHRLRPVDTGGRTALPGELSDSDEMFLFRWAYINRNTTETYSLNRIYGFTFPSTTSRGNADEGIYNAGHRSRVTEIIDPLNQFVFWAIGCSYGGHFKTYVHRVLISDGYYGVTGHCKPNSFEYSASNMIPQSFSVHPQSTKTTPVLPIYVSRPMKRTAVLGSGVTSTGEDSYDDASASYQCSN